MPKEFAKWLSLGTQKNGISFVSKVFSSLEMKYQRDSVNTSITNDNNEQQFRYIFHCQKNNIKKTIAIVDFSKLQRSCS